VKLKKRLPESRSQKKERLASDKDRKGIERERAMARREQWIAQQEKQSAHFHTWRHAVNNRLESDEAYARFEEIHRGYWDYFRHVGMPDTELSLAIQRWRDGRSVDAEVLVSALVEDEYFSRHLASFVRKLARSRQLSGNQVRRVQRFVLIYAEYPGWHADYRHLARLARAVPENDLAERLAQLPETPMRDALLGHLAQEASMRAAK
jgi:hypothetical protein